MTKLPPKKGYMPITTKHTSSVYLMTHPVTIIHRYYCSLLIGSLKL